MTHERDHAHHRHRHHDQAEEGSALSKTDSGPKVDTQNKKTNRNKRSGQHSAEYLPPLVDVPVQNQIVKAVVPAKNVLLSDKDVESPNESESANYNNGSTSQRASIVSLPSSSAASICSGRQSASGCRAASSSMSASRSGVSSARPSSVLQGVHASRTRPAPFPVNTLIINSTDGSLRNVTYGRVGNASVVLPWLGRGRTSTSLTEAIQNPASEATPTSTASDMAIDMNAVAASTSTAHSTASAGALGHGSSSLQSDSSTGLSDTGKTVLGSVLGSVGGLAVLGALVFLVFSHRKRQRKNKRGSQTALASEKQRSYMTNWSTPISAATAAIEARQIGSAGESSVAMDTPDRSFQVISGQRLPQPPLIGLPASQTRGSAPTPIVLRGPQDRPLTVSARDPDDPFSDAAAIAWPRSAGLVVSDAQPSTESSPAGSPRVPRLTYSQPHTSRASLTASGSRFFEHDL